MTMRKQVPSLRRLRRPGLSRVGMFAVSGQDFISRYGASGLVSYWKLEEASGNRADTYGGNTLTDNNTVTQQTGKLGMCGQFTGANNEWLSIADNASLSCGDIDFTLSCWVYADALAGLAGIVSKTKSPGGNSDVEYFIIFRSATTRFGFGVGDGTNFSEAVANTLGNPSAATWYFVVGWHDSVANTVNIQVNNGAVDSAAHATGCQDSDAAFQIGSLLNTATNCWDGRIDSVAFWKRVLTSSERSYLYNAGLGRAVVGAEP